MSEAPSRRKNRWIQLISVAVLLGLGVYACYPGPDFKEWPGSPPAPSPDGSRTAQVIFRQARPPSFSLTWEGGDGFRSRLRVTESGGAMREFGSVFSGHLGWWKVGETPLKLAWEEPWRMRIEGARARGYDLGTCVRLVREDDLKVVTEAGVPLPGSLVSRLMAIGRPEAEVRGLKQVRLELDDPVPRVDAVVCERPDLLLILGPKRTGSVTVVSRGPVLLEGEAYPSSVGSSSWVLLTDRTSVSEKVDGSEIYATEQALGWRDRAGRTPIPVR